MNKKENMAQSRVLWVILSALTVMAIVIGAGIFFFFPSTDGNRGLPQLSSLNNETQSRDFDHIEYVRNDEGFPQMVDPDEMDEEYSVDSSTNELPVTVEEVDPMDVDLMEIESPVVEVAPEAVKPVVAVKTPVKPVTPVVQKQETMKISVTVYWIQVGSYNDLIKAEEVRDYLLLKDISSQIQTKTVEGNTYYRVRIGAFQSKGEADRFLVPIKEMENFNESYVVQTTMVKEVPVK
jgi:DedD protein